MHMNDQPDPEIQLLIPSGDDASLLPEISIVVPALNEQLTIAEFISWCKEGLKAAGARGEILIVDSSTDKTAEIALANGARVLKTPKRGLGRAYIDALPYVRGPYVLMGDCDCTYDFRQLKPFHDKFKEGYEYIMGSRFKGTIEAGSMPPLHQYLGTPVTTWILNVIFGSHFSDIHCGMRGITRDAFLRLDLKSQAWEYASELVLKSVRMGLKTAEVPISFLKDKDGRLSHHKRSGWWSPWHAAWINLRAMFVYGADFFLLKPGIFILALGAARTLPLALGPLTLGPVTFSLYWMLLGVCLSVLGLQCVYMGMISQVVLDFHGRHTTRWSRLFPYTPSVLAAVATCMAGAALCIPLAYNYVQNGLSFQDRPEPWSHLAVLGLLLMIGGFMHFTFTLLLHAGAMAVSDRLKRITGK